MLHVPEVLGHGQAGQRHPHTDAGRFVHLAEDQRRLICHAALPHFPPEVIALPAPLTYAGEDGIAVVLHGYVVNQLLDQHGLTHTGAAEQADLAALGIRLQQVDDLDTGLQNLHGGALILKRGRIPVNALAGRFRRERLSAVDGLAQHVEHPAQRLLSYRDLNGLAGSGYLHAPGQTLAARQHDAADDPLAHVLGYLHHAGLAVQLHGQRFLDLRQMSGFKLHIYHRAGYLRDRSDFHCYPSLPKVLRCAAAPAEISVIS